MFKIIETTEGKFGIKNLDEQGNSLGMREEVFDTHEEASAFIVSLEGTPTAGPTDDTQAPEAPEAAPVLRTYKVVAEAGIPGANDGDNDIAFGEVMELDPESDRAKGFMEAGFIEEVVVE